MAEACAVRVLGRFAVTIGGRRVPDEAWRHRRGADLVKLLALAAGHRLHREQAMDALWPDLPPDAAAANLRKAAHFARRAMGAGDAVMTEGNIVALWPTGELSVDLDLFHGAVSGDPATALDLYRGDVLPDEPYAAWTSAARERARLEYVRLLRAAGMWDRLLEADGSDEEAHRELMRAHLAGGNRQAAIRQFERLRESLREELGVSPDAETVELYEEVLAMDGHEPPSAQERARALLAWGLVHWNRHDLKEAERTAGEARALAIDVGLGHELGEASALLGLVAHAQGRWSEVFREEFADSMRRTPELAVAVFDAHLCFAEFSLYGPQGHEDVAPFARELLALAEEWGSLPGRALAMLMLGEVELLSGRMDEAEEALTDAASLHDAVARDSGRALSLERLAELHLARGQRWKAGRLLAKAKSLAQASALTSHLVVRVLGAEVQSAPPGRALDAVRKAEGTLDKRDVCDPCSMGFRVAAAAAAARAGDLGRASRYLDEVERIAGMWQGGPWLAAAWETRGEVRLAEGERDQAAALFREAADAFARVRRPMDEARCRAAAGAIA